MEDSDFLKIEEYKTLVSLINTNTNALLGVTSIFMAVMVLIWGQIISYSEKCSTEDITRACIFSSISLMVPTLWLYSAYKNGRKVTIRMERCKEIERYFLSKDMEFAAFSITGKRLKVIEKKGRKIERFLISRRRVLQVKFPMFAFFISAVVIVITGFSIIR